jgi:hypothetical protein
VQGLRLYQALRLCVSPEDIAIANVAQPLKRRSLWIAFASIDCVEIQKLSERQR